MDNQFFSASPAEIVKAVSDFKNIHEILLSNFFGISEKESYQMLKTEKTLIIRKKEHDFYRLYLMATDEAELTHMLLSLSKDTYVINIPSKKGIDNWKKVLDGAGFSFFAQYDRYNNRQIEYRESEIGTYATIKDADEILTLLYDDSFSIYTDYIPTKVQLEQMINNKQVLVNKDDNQVKGVLIFTIEGKKCYLNIWIDKTKDGLFLLFDVYNIMVEKGIVLSYFWVKSTNKKIRKLHMLTGAIPDGLSDYSYIKR